MKSLVGTLLALPFLAGAAYVVWASLTGRPVPFVSSPQAAVWAVVGLGLVACTLGGVGAGLANAGGSWANPFVIIGAILGSALLVLAAAQVFGFTLPLIADERAALMAIATVMAAKFLLTSTQAIVKAVT